MAMTQTTDDKGRPTGEATAPGHRPEFSISRIGKWLRAYLDWKAEVGEGPSLPSTTDYSKPVVMGGSGNSGGPSASMTERAIELQHKTKIVEYWLSTLTPAERLAAEWWLKDDDGTYAAVALVTGLEYRKAKLLVDAIPVIIWSRFYAHINSA